MAGFFIPDEKNIDSLFKEASKKAPSNPKDESSNNDSIESNNKDNSVKKTEEDNKKITVSEKDENNGNTANSKSEMMNRFQQNLISKNSTDENKEDEKIVKSDGSKEESPVKDKKSTEENSSLSPEKEIKNANKKAEEVSNSKQEEKSKENTAITKSDSNKKPTSGLDIQEVAKIISMFNLLNNTDDDTLNFVYKIVPNEDNKKNIENNQLSDKDKKFSYLIHSLILLEKDDINDIKFIMSLLKTEDRVDRAFKILETDSEQVERTSYMVERLLDKENPEKIRIENQDIFRIVAKELESSVQQLLEKNKNTIKGAEQIFSKVSL